jgi:hypothetical protein
MKAVSWRRQLPHILQANNPPLTTRSTVINILSACEDGRRTGKKGARKRLGHFLFILTSYLIVGTIGH